MASLFTAFWRKPARSVLPNPKQKHKHIPSPVRLVFGLAVLVLFGTLLLMLPISGTARPLSWNEALFTATSALSVTGMATIVPVRDLSLFGQTVLLLLMQLGGVGFMVMAVVILRVLGRKISLVDRQSLSDSLGLVAPGAVLKLTKRVLIVVLIIESIGALLLYLHWRTDLRLTHGQAAFFAIFHAVSAFCNAGFDLFLGMPAYPDGLPRDTATLSIIGVMVLIGGLGIPVLADIGLFWRERRVSLHTRITLAVLVFLVVSGMVGFFVAERHPESNTLVGESLPRQLFLSFFHSISARSAGFAGVANFTEMTPASQLLTTTLMFIGAAPASMGGGITTGTFAVLAISLWGFVRGHPNAIVGGRTLSAGTVRKASAVLTISLFVVLLSIWLILMTHKDATLDQATFEVVSAFATCGLSLGFTNELNLFGQMVIVLMMFWGRLGALTIVVAIAKQMSHNELVQYPEEKILIG